MFLTHLLLLSSCIRLYFVEVGGTAVKLGATRSTQSRPKFKFAGRGAGALPWCRTSALVMFNTAAFPGREEQGVWGNT